MTKIFTDIVFAMLFIMFAASVARADTFDWTITSGGTGSGTFTTDTSNQITEISGSLTLGDGITVLYTNDTITPALYINPLTDQFSGTPGTFYSIIMPQFGAIDQWELLSDDTFADLTAPMPLADILSITITSPIATPEPSSVILTLLGIGSLLVMRKRIAQNPYLAT